MAEGKLNTLYLAVLPDISSIRGRLTRGTFGIRVKTCHSDPFRRSEILCRAVRVPALYPYPAHSHQTV